MTSSSDAPSPTQYVRSLEIDQHIIPRPPKLVEGKGQELVDAGSLIIFSSSVTLQSRSDILNSTLLAQLATNKSFDKNQKQEDWYRKYVDTLGNLGWVVQNFAFKMYSSHEKNVSIEDIIVKDATSVVSRASVEILKRTLIALHSDRNKRWWEVFDEQVTGKNCKGIFQIIFCDQHSANEATINMISVYFETKVHHRRWLQQKYETSTMRIFSGHQVLTLNEGVYSKIRKVVEEKLGNKVHQYIGDLQVTEEV